MATNIITAIAHRLQRAFIKGKKSFLAFRRHSLAPLNTTGSILFALAVLGALCCLISLVLYYGFDHSLREFTMLKRVVHAVQIIFIAEILFTEIFGPQHHVRLGYRLLHLVVEIPVVLTIFPLLYPRPDAPWLPLLSAVIYSNAFIFITMAAYSILCVSRALMRFVNQRANPSLILSVSFLILIIIGSLLLSLPKCNNMPLSYFDALFVSTSAVCITGLTPVDVATQFTPLGWLVLASLVEIGALGLMTFTYFFALFFNGNSSIFSQMMIRDVVYARSLNVLLPTILYIFSFTIIIEMVGAVAIWYSVKDTLGLSSTDYVIFAIFHSISSFCNAGFSTLPSGMANQALLIGNQSIYWITTLMVVAGGIGFPILVNFKDAVKTRIVGLFRKNADRPLHLYNMNTKIVFTFYFALLAIGAGLFLLFEYHNSLEGMTLGQKITQSVFNSSTPRSSGFVSVDPAGFLNITLVMVMFLMWIGGASQSTAGGIKVNTFAAMYYNLVAVLKGKHSVTAFHRRIAGGSIRRAFAVAALSIVAYLIFAMVILWLNPQLPARDLLFEVMSALFTVGSSLGVTDRLTDTSLVVLSGAMFLGRVGIISLLTGLMSSRNMVGVRYPEDDIIIS